MNTIDPNARTLSLRIRNYGSDPCTLHLFRPAKYGIFDCKFPRDIDVQLIESSYRELQSAIFRYKIQLDRYRMICSKKEQLLEPIMVTRSRHAGNLTSLSHKPEESWISEDNTRIDSLFPYSLDLFTELEFTVHPDSRIDLTLYLSALQEYS